MNLIFKILINIIFIGLTFFSLQANDNPKFNIGYYDLENDIRYSEWGIHPVDIRSDTNKTYKKPVAGAELGLKDIKPFQRMAKVNFELLTKSIKDTENIGEIIYNHILENNIKIIITDLPKNELLKVVTKVSDLNISLMNISERDNSIRSEQCHENLFHIIPSNRMLTDSLAQYLSDKKWRKVLILTGPLKEDEEKSNSFKESAKQFGLKVVDERKFLLGNDPRARDQNDLDFLTGSNKYDAVYISDTHREFSYKVPFATQQPAAVVGSAGLIARAWHWSYLRHGAPQVHGRFERMHNRRMTEENWASWVAMRMIAEALVRFKSDEKETNLNEVFNNPQFKIGGSKGPALTFRPWNRQLRQTIMISSENWVTSIAPLEGFVHRDNNLDTIGMDAKTSNCIIN